MKTTRRTFIGSLAASTVPASVAVSKPVPKLSDEEQLELCISQLREVLLRLHPDTAWRSHIDRSHAYCLIVGDKRDDEPFATLTAGQAEPQEYVR